MPTAPRSETSFSSEADRNSLTTPNNWLAKRTTAAQIKISRTDNSSPRCLTRASDTSAPTSSRLNRLIPDRSPAIAANGLRRSQVHHANRLMHQTRFTKINSQESQYPDTSTILCLRRRAVLKLNWTNSPLRQVYTGKVPSRCRLRRIGSRLLVLSNRLNAADTRKSAHWGFAAAV